MTKFNLELRISIVTQYLTGISSIQLARKYHIANNETILLWVHRFNCFGIAGLKPRPMNLEYSSENNRTSHDFDQIARNVNEVAE